MCYPSEFFAGMPTPLFSNVFRRVTQSGRFLPEVDGLRFLAILSVLLCHAFQITSQASPLVDPDENYELLPGICSLQGRQGVFLFFVLSGFILALPFARHYLLGQRPVLIRAYFLRRLTRLEVPYLFSLLAFALAIRYLIHRDTAEELLPHWLASSVYAHNLLYARHSTVSTVAWTLEIEVQFYLLAPLLMRVFQLPLPWRRDVLGGTLLVFAFFFDWINQRTDNGLMDNGLTLHGLSDVWQLTLPAFLSFFVGGLLLADWYVSGTFSTVLGSPGWFWLGLIGLLAYGLGMDLWKAYWSALWPLVMVLIVGAGLFSTWWRTGWGWSFFSLLGGMCYSIYLWHHGFMALSTRFVPALPLTGSLLLDTWVRIGFVIFFALLGSIPLFLLIEKPCMYADWPERLGRRIRAMVSYA